MSGASSGRGGSDATAAEGGGGGQPIGSVRAPSGNAPLRAFGQRARGPAGAPPPSRRLQVPACLALALWAGSAQPEYGSDYSSRRVPRVPRSPCPAGASREAAGRAPPPLLPPSPEARLFPCPASLFRGPSRAGSPGRGTKRPRGPPRGSAASGHVRGGRWPRPRERCGSSAGRCAVWAAAAHSRLKRRFAGANGVRRGAVRSVPWGQERDG